MENVPFIDDLPIKVVFFHSFLYVDQEMKQLPFYESHPRWWQINPSYGTLVGKYGIVWSKRHPPFILNTLHPFGPKYSSSSSKSRGGLRAQRGEWWFFSSRNGPSAFHPHQSHKAPKKVDCVGWCRMSYVPPWFSTLEMCDLTIINLTHLFWTETQDLGSLVRSEWCTNTIQKLAAFASSVLQENAQLRPGPWEWQVSRLEAII